MKIAIVIPTYRRPKDLQRCLTALETQTQQADEVLVVVRNNDEETQAFLVDYRTSLPLRRVCVNIPGVIAAMSAGLQAASGDIIALTDDDTAPYPDWLERIENHFAADPQVGGVGGRDWQPVERGDQHVVGKIQWHGRVVGNHHLGTGGAREVDVLKGANCAYRAGPLKQIGFETRLRGGGAQVHWELALGMAMRQAGWKLIYDPAVALDHYPAKRFDEDTNLRGIFNAEGVRNSAYNETLVLLSYLPPLRRVAFLVWAFLIGTRVEPGLAQIPRITALRDCNRGERIRATFAGRTAALITALRAGRETPQSEKGNCSKSS